MAVNGTSSRRTRPPCGKPSQSDSNDYFHGRAADAQTRLSYFGARYYDPAIGRYMGVDPKGFDEGNLASFNRYAYGKITRIRYRDPDGHSPIDLAFLGRKIYGSTRRGYSIVWVVSSPAMLQRSLRRSLNVYFRR